MVEMKKLYRSQRDKKLFGLCGGLADMLGVDATLLRVIVIVTTFFTGGAMIAVYFIAALVIPKEPTFGSPLMSGPWNGYSAAHQPHMHAQPHAHMPHQPYATAQSMPPAAAYPQTATTEKARLDEVMSDIEKKAMWKEIQELKTKLSNYEKGEV
ncbi:PspC domain-containing protein [Paenibacillus koleovorans]|uniref:PspC domain-containing protein n=1 Tax=Paenibacillus koleovorans TaxID=121608 RepID=UPI000FDCC341|nr:PspC domain-containing protein [Paenibacillus koleovorans]